jgi:hypothetical protein
MKSAQKLSFEEAKRMYVHRFTVEYIPAWADKPAPNGKYYAPQFLTDQEWYDHTIFPPQSPFPDSCYTTGQTWPLGQWLDAPLRPYVTDEDVVNRDLVEMILDRIEDDLYVKSIVGDCVLCHRPVPEQDAVHTVCGLSHERCADERYPMDNGDGRGPQL